jgi:hypothetical protein
MLDTRRYAESLGLDTRQESGCAEIEGTPLHTLGSTGALARYAGAKIDDGYSRERDGRVKMDRLARDLLPSSAP